MRQIPEAAGPLHNARVLIAEDEIMIALDLESALRHAGAEVVGPFMTLTAALQAAEDGSLSAAILDIRLGRDTTEAVAMRLHALNVPFLFYSGQVLPESLRALLPDATVIEKPAGQAALITAVCRLLARQPLQPTID